MPSLFKLIYVSLIVSIGVSVASVHAQSGPQRDPVLLPVALGNVTLSGTIGDQ